MIMVRIAGPGRYAPPVEAVGRPPEGTIAFLFTDIEGSTRLASTLGTAWGDVLAAHHAVIGGSIAAEGGFVDGTEGDAFFATFDDAAAAARAAVQALRGLRSHPWPPEVGELGVRMGLHVGHVERRATGYVGLEVHRAARVAAAAHGGQLLMTAAARALLGDVVPVEPVGAHRLKDFPRPEPLFCAVVDGRGAAAFPPPRTEELRPTNLPPGTSTLLGREEALARIREALVRDGDRLVTVTGRGGVGKTTLALVGARELLDEHPGGVWLVKLAGLGSPDEVLPAVAAAVDAERDITGSALQAVVRRLRDRGPTLIVVDNLEHLLSATPQLQELLDALPTLRLLVTSQAPLRLAEERCVPLDALADDAALELIDRVAGRRGTSISGTGPFRAALLEVIHLLDGLPLALELAAARLELFSPVQLRDRLRESVDVLKDAASGRPDRQRSLRATVEWTLALLESDSRALFIRLGAFAGAVELEDIESVAGHDGLDVVEALARLLDVALVRRVEAGDGRLRFGLPQALRQISAGLLDAEPDAIRWRRAHAERQHDLLRAAPLWLAGGRQYLAARAADAEANKALQWTRRAGDPIAAPLAARRAALLAETGRVREALSVIEPLLENLSGDPDVDGYAFLAHSYVLMVIDRLDDAMRSIGLGLELASDPAVRSLLLGQRSVIQTFRDEHDASVSSAEQSVAVARGLGSAAFGGALIVLAQAHLFAGHLDLAAEQLSEAEQIAAETGGKLLWSIDTVWADLAVSSGRIEDGLERYVRSLESAQARDDQLQVMFDLFGVANALALLHDDDHALETLGIAEAHAIEVSGPAARAVQHLLDRDLLTAAERLVGAEAADELKARGHAVPAGRRVSRACDLAWARQPA